MNELVKIEVKDGQQLVSGRELHEFLEAGTPYDKWFPRMCEYGFSDGKDFSTFLSESTGGRPATNHWLTIPMAKEISMLQRSKKGKQARQYFIKCEEAWNSPEMILARANQIQSRMIEQHTEKIKILETKIEEDKPKVLFADAVATSQSSILIGDLAKLLKQNGIDTGQKRLFNYLRENGFLMKQKGESYNMPTQKSMELGLFEIKERTGVNPDGSIRISRTPKVTGKGQQYFINLFLKEKIA
ncbi:phage antirepressor KilAC domain-containing protein [Fusobacterium necrophorum]|uniref:phage antirepressor KilAC domain-containing protein n=1 Tax=Fusobacterium necrophorum TaxID=859 RepID=UPI00254F2900|nr:phage antirepressor KilAC domain-containing protein [Fusobacterium necrophorum]MDK4477063.1 phage antirepressor KilAC domain-containing protein [Fusobacterium necrophorum]